MAGLGITDAADAKALPEDMVRAHLNHNIERLAEAEHDGWREVRERNGWRYAPVRDDGQLLHPLLVPYSTLKSEVAKEKDRDAVRHYPEMVALAEFRIVWLDHETQQTSPDHLVAGP